MALVSIFKPFSFCFQLQKNCLLTLCSDHILQVAPFDRSVHTHFLSALVAQCIVEVTHLDPCRYEAAKLIMMMLGNHEDQTVQRMAVAVVSILVSKVITSTPAFSV